MLRVPEKPEVLTSCSFPCTFSFHLVNLCCLLSSSRSRLFEKPWSRSTFVIICKLKTKKENTVARTLSRICNYKGKKS